MRNHKIHPPKATPSTEKITPIKLLKPHSKVLYRDNRMQILIISGTRLLKINFNLVIEVVRGDGKILLNEFDVGIDFH